MSPFHTTSGTTGTPQPLFFNLTTEWAASLQKMVANEVPVDVTHYPREDSNL